MSDFEIIENTEEAEDTYGHCYGSRTCEISRGDIEALLNGKQLATDDRRIYDIYSFRRI